MIISSEVAGAGNPYRQVGRVAAGERFIGRRDLVRLVQAAWQEPGRPSNVRVLGHHRTGKTSLVLYAMHTSPVDRADLVSVTLNVGSQDCGSDLFRSMTRRVLEGLNEWDGPDRHADLAAIDHAVQASVAWYDLREAVRAFFKAARRAERFVLVVLDEFDRASTAFTRLAEFQLLRDLASDPQFSLGLITISRRPIESIEMDAAGGSILGGVVTMTRYVGMFTDAEADLLLARAAAAGVGLAAVRDQIVERAGLHPFLLELLCNRIVETCQETGRLDVSAAYDLEAPTFEQQFAQLLGNIDADSGGRGLTLLRRVAAGTGSEPPSLDLNRLCLMGVVSRGPGGLALFSAELARHVLMNTVPSVP